MALIVQKFGGTSVQDVERIRNVAKRVIETRKAGHDVVVVLSAMAGETNRLIDLTKAISREADTREYDQVIATGEQVTIGLLALALIDQGQPAQSYLGSQVRILTDSVHSKARIQKIDADPIVDSLKAGKVVVVAGFQGVDSSGNITTLGRGGSDTTAVALAAALKADLCEIYTDVDGVYTTDPRICPDARKLKKIAYEEMLELASLGAKVLQIRSVEFAAKYGVNLVVRSSFNHNEGTLVCKEDQSMEDVIVSGVALDINEAKVSLRGLPDKPGIASHIFSEIAGANINVDMIVQNVSAEGHTDLTFTVPTADLAKAKSLIEKVGPAVGCKKVEADEGIAKVSIVGVGMRSHAGVAAKVFSTLASQGINIQMISTSEIKVSVVVAKDQGKEAVKVLHAAFELAK